MPLSRSLPLMPLRNPPAERGERTRSLAAEFNAATSAPKSEQPSIIIVVAVAVLTRERVESILTTHLLKNNLVRSLSSRLFKRGFNRAVRPESCLLRVSAGAFSKISAGATFCIHHFSAGRKAARQTDGQRDMRAASSAAATLLGQAGAKKVNATKSGDKRRKPKSKEMYTATAFTPPTS